ncbi:TIGR02449 family protein [Atopomonas sediminilitoris]|uniref:TIGR02449 family protein n=1 Tax=Atopomonas sediminilitoris TaxID=2919919 RepID=UPI001F4D5CCD|nr:TIGR02449 family protein [Atopomonas sediminilitoris]MCJ8168273.1 TIGR02449 family protein [Atopomonas sediminilitoris]
MENVDLQALHDKLDNVLKQLDYLRRHNHALLASEQAWREERAQLIEKNELAKHKVESMIQHLKSLEQDG